MRNTLALLVAFAVALVLCCTTWVGLQASPKAWGDNKRHVSWTAQQGAIPVSSTASLTTRSGHPVIELSDGAIEHVTFHGLLPPRISEDCELDVDVQFASDASSGDAQIEVSLERIEDGSQDLDVEGYATPKAEAQAVSGTPGVTSICSVRLTAANCDGIKPGEYFRLRIRRDARGSNASDTAAGSVQVLAVDLREAN